MANFSPEYFLSKSFAVTEIIYILYLESVSDLKKAYDSINNLLS